LNTGLLEVIVPSPDYYPNFDTLQDTFGDTMERVRQDVSGITIIESKIVIPIILNNHIESNWRCWVTWWNDYFIWQGPALQR